MNIRTLFPSRFANLTLACSLAVGLAAPVCRAADPSDKTALPRLSIAEAGAVPDGVTRNTKAIQAAIDQLAGKGGGTLVVPAGRFLSGDLPQARRQPAA